MQLLKTFNNTIPNISTFTLDISGNGEMLPAFMILTFFTDFHLSHKC